MICKECHEELDGHNYYTLAKTHGKYFLVPGVMKGSFTNENLFYCKSCAEKMKIEIVKFEKN